MLQLEKARLDMMKARCIMALLDEFAIEEFDWP